MTPTSPHLTATGAALGTPAYMAPEQFSAGEVDARANQFAFCVVLHEALAGKRPFAGTNYGELRANVTGAEPEPLPRGKAPAWLARVLRRGLARDPEARWPDMVSLLAALERRRPGRRARIARRAPASPRSTSPPGPRRAARPAAVAPTICDAAGAEIDAVWTPARRDALVARFTGLDATIGKTSPRARALSAEAWVTAYKDAASKSCRPIASIASGPPGRRRSATLCLRRGAEARSATSRARAAGRAVMPEAPGDLRSPFPSRTASTSASCSRTSRSPADPARPPRSTT